MHRRDRVVRRRRALTACAALAALAITGGAAQAAAPAPEVRPIYFEHLTMRDGLSQSTVMSILQDSQGYLWMATESGLDRYDGYTIRAYRRERGDESGLASDYIWKIAEDARGDLWLATVGGGVARWDRRTDRFQQFRHDPGDPQSLASDAIRTLLIDAQGLVWIGTFEHGLDVLDPQTGEVRHFRHRDDDPRSLAADAVYALHADHAGRIWIGTDSGLSRYEPSSNDFVNYGRTPGASGFSDVHIRSLLEDHAGVLWIGTLGGGLNRLDPETGRISSFRHDPDDPDSLSNDRVQAILEDDAHRLWVATRDGLNLFDRSSGTFVRYARDAGNPQSLRDSDVMSLHQDRGGVLWVGTRAGGASRWNPDSWLLGHFRSDALADAAVFSFADDGAGKVWVGTSAGLLEIDTRTRGERLYDSGSGGALRLPDERVMALLYDRGGALWIGTMTAGLLRFDSARGSMRAYQHDPGDESTLPANGVMTLYEDRAGDLWVGTFGGGLARIERSSGRVIRYPNGDGNALSDARAQAIVEDALGNLWIGTGGGLNLLDRRTGRFHHYRRNDRDPSSLSDDAVYALHVDRRGDLWIGTAGGGLDRMVGSSSAPQAVRFENQSGYTGIASQVVYGIESDVEGRLWLSTNDGLARLDPRDRSIKFFHEAHGLQGEDFNFNAHYRGRDGALYFGGNNGFNAFYPDAVTSDVPPPRVVLTSVAKLNRPLAPQDMPSATQPLALSYGDKLVTFEFAALDFTSPENNRYAWRLDGFDSDWIDAGGVRRATYTNLDAGEYVFRVRAANADGAWSTEGLAIPVHVAAAPWNTSAARALYAALILLALGYLWRVQRMRRERALRYSRQLEHTVKVRTHELEERNQQLQVLSRAKSDFVARMSHELRTPMNGVLGMTGLLMDTRLDAAQRRFAEAIHRSADSLLAIVDDVLDFSKIEAGRLQLDPVDCNLVELVEQTAEMLAARAASKGVELLCDSPAQPLPRVRVDAVRLRQVLVNLGGNAVKFTDRGEVTLRVASSGCADGALAVRLEVVDTGVGIEPANQLRIFEEFTQEDASTTRRFGGTGLGLSISRQLVELMGGKLNVVSAPGAGSTFSFELSLPLAEPAAQLPPPLPGLDGLRTLVVDDNDAARCLMVRALRDWGARAIGAASAPEALKELRATAYDAVVIDDSLTDGDAFSLLKAMLAERAAKPRTIRLASFVSLTPAQQSAEPRFDVELSKPLRLMQLHDAVRGQLLQALQPQRLQELTPALPALRGRVLVVEDQALNREVAQGMLNALGVQATCANDGRQALEELAAERYDAVLMDCQMPVMDGFAATTELRRREDPKLRTPVIALTADATREGREACLAAGMDDYLAKPFSRAALHAVLARWLGAGPAGAATAALAGPDAGAAIAPGDLLDRATLNALRALPNKGSRDMLSHIVERYLTDSRELVASIERAIDQGEAADLARAAHAWRSYNGNVGANTLAGLCREMEDRAREGDFDAARALLGELRSLHARVREELQFELRRSA